MVIAVAENLGLMSGAADPESRHDRMKRSKGEETRSAILDAVVACYCEHGYAQTTQEKVAEKAGLSMGAVTYHFGSIADLSKAAIDHAFKRRLEQHSAAIAEAVKISWDFETTLEIYWRSVTNPHFVACHELSVAARTDPSLYAVLTPAYERFRVQWNRGLRRLHPEWKGTGDMFRFAVEYSTHLMEGMAVEYLLHGHDEQRMRNMRAFLKDTLESLLVAGRSGQSVSDLLAPGRRRRAARRAETDAAKQA